MFKYLGAALGVAALFMAPAPAQAAEQCYGAGVSDAEVYVCVDFQLNAAGTTVAPSYSVRCDGSLTLCRVIVARPGSIGTTGFVPNPSYPEPCVDAAAGTIRGYEGTLGTLFVDGVATPVNVPAFFVGNPGGC